ncbi:hypothetical protein pb186bvf_018988 [Paramecium bursaria]
MYTITITIIALVEQIVCSIACAVMMEQQGYLFQEIFDAAILIWYSYLIIFGIVISFLLQLILYISLFFIKESNKSHAFTQPRFPILFIQFCTLS